MTETLGALLLRLSEADGPAVLWGRRARPHFGRAFERLLASGVLVEQAPAESWPPCADCECGLDVRPIQTIGGRLVAACPWDAGADAVLAPDDLRNFVIDEQRLVEGLAEMLPGSELVEPVPGLWGFGLGPTGRALFLTLRRSVANDPALLAVMRAGARGAGITLVAPRPTGAVLMRLRDATDLRVVSIAEAATLDEMGRLRLESVVDDAPSSMAPRLVLQAAAQTVLVDGSAQPVPAQPFRLLLLLVEKARGGGGPVENRKIYDATGRDARDLVRELREALAAGRPKPGEIRGWIKARRSAGGFELTLHRDQIDLCP